MDTGILSIALHQLPYRFRGLGILSTIMFVLNLVLYILFITMYLLRWFYYPSQTLEHTVEDAEELALLATPAISYLTLIAQVALTCSQQWGYGFTIVAYVLWWIGLVWILAVCTNLYINMIKRPSGRLVDRWLPTAVFVPIVGMMTAATVGGLIINNARDVSPGLAVPVIIVGFFVLGYGMLLALVVYSIYTHRLLTAGWPPPEKIPGMILTVRPPPLFTTSSYHLFLSLHPFLTSLQIGPCGQAASAIQLLGLAADQHHFFASYNHGIFLTGSPVSTSLHTACILLALLLLGFATFWILVAYYAILEDMLRKRTHPSLAWWSTIFPVASVATAFETLAEELDSDAFRVLATGLIIFLFVIYFVDAAFTLPMTLSGRLLGIRRRHGLLEGAPLGHAWSGLPRTAPAS